MIIFLYGPDSYRKGQKLNEFTQQFQQKNSAFTKEDFDLSQTEDFYRLKDFCGQNSIFAIKKMAVIKNIFDDKKSKDKLLSEIKELFLKYLDDENMFLMISEEDVPVKDFKFLIEKPVFFQEFSELKGVKMEAFITKELKERNLSADLAGIKYLAKTFSGNTWAVVTAIESLQNLSSNKNVTLKEIEKVVDYSQTSNLFLFMDAISKQKPLKSKLVFVEELVLSREDGAKIFNILASRPFLNSELIEKLADYDIAIKSGKLDYELALLDLCLG